MKRWLMLIALMSAGCVYSQTMKVSRRPLTPQNIADLNLPSTTQTANGTQAVGIGQPVYLELLVAKGTVVTSTTWRIDRVRRSFDDVLLASTAMITTGPLDVSVAPFDAGDADEFDVAARSMLVPDIQGTWDISVDVGLLSGMTTVVLTNAVVGGKYLGREHYLCVLCHYNKQADFPNTKHATAFEDQINGGDSSHFNANCISCHALGYDKTPGAVNDGFDDVATSLGWTFPSPLTTNTWDSIPEALQQKANVQCENCHGPASEHVTSGGSLEQRRERIGISLSAGNCGQCHDRATHHVKVSEWTNAAHSHGYVFRDSGSCAQCHSSLGFINSHDPDYNGPDPMDGQVYGLGNPEVRGTGNEGLGCATCHDPHRAGGKVHQLRDLPSVVLGNGVEITDGGAGVLCMNCHKSRANAEVDAPNYTGSRFPGHHGSEGDMLAGQNAVEYGMNMPSSRHLTQVDQSCAGCHMQTVKGTAFDAATGKAGGHTWKMVWDNDTTNTLDDVDITLACQQCHGDVTSFDFGGEDYDRDGVVEGVQSEIEGMMEELAMLLPPVGSSTVSVSSSYTIPQRKAAYNYMFVEEDASHGVHNPKYAAAILRASIEDVKGGIDIDCDGLVDFYEMQVFGSLTLATGDGDFDGDGLSNKAEQKLGTNPKLKDSDNDGVFDPAELQAMTNPMDPTSTPDPSKISLIPAMEVAFLPEAASTEVQFQKIDVIDGMTWTNVGPAQAASGDWVFLLQSMRETTNVFYRALEQ